MGKIIFRKKEILEYCTICCCFFAISIIINYLPRIEIGYSLLYRFIIGYYDIRHEISIGLTFFALLFQYMIIIRKKKEIYIRIVVGDTLKKIRIRYLITCLVISSILFIFAIIIKSLIGLELIDHIYIYILLCLWTYLTSIFLRFIR